MAGLKSIAAEIAELRGRVEVLEARAPELAGLPDASTDGQPGEAPDELSVLESLVPQPGRHLTPTAVTDVLAGIEACLQRQADRILAGDLDEALRVLQPLTLEHGGLLTEVLGRVGAYTPRRPEFVSSRRDAAEATAATRRARAIGEGPYRVAALDDAAALLSRAVASLARARHAITEATA